MAGPRPLDVQSSYFGQHELIGTTMGSPGDLARLLAFHQGAPGAAAGDRPDLPLDHARDAHRRLESGDGIATFVLMH